MPTHYTRVDVEERPLKELVICQMLVYRLADINFEVTLFFKIFLSGDRHLSGGETDCHDILHGIAYMSRTCLLSFWGRYPQRRSKSEILGLYKANVSKR